MGAPASRHLPSPGAAKLFKPGKAYGIADRKPGNLLNGDAAMAGQKQGTSSARSDSVGAAREARMPPWLRKIGMAAAKAAIIGTIAASTLFGNPIGDRPHSHFRVQDRRPAVAKVVERAAESFRPQAAWAQPIGLEEALELLKSPVETQEAAEYYLKSKNTEPFVMKSKYEGQTVAIAIGSETKLLVRVGSEKAYWSIDIVGDDRLVDYFSGKSQAFSEHTKFVAFDMSGIKKNVIGMMIADSGKDKILLLTVEITEANQYLGLGGTTMDLGFELSGKFDMNVVKAKGTEYGAVVLYDSTARRGVVFPFDSKPLPAIIIWPEDGVSPTFDQIEVVPVKQGNTCRIVIKDPTWLGVMEYIPQQDAMEVQYDGTYLAMK